jgi:WD40 repeat protein
MPGLILTGHESGKVALFDARSGDEVLSNERAHMDVVTDLQLSADRSYFITSSKDKTARIHDAKTLTVLKTFQTETPLNSAALAPNMPYVRPFLLHHSWHLDPMLLSPFSYIGPAGRRSGSHERHDDVTATGQIRSPFLASRL